MGLSRVLVPFSAWLALGVLMSACSPARSAGVAATEAPTQSCAIAYPEATTPDQPGAESLADSEGKEPALKSAPRPLVPPIDAAARARTEIATFALG